MPSTRRSKTRRSKHKTAKEGTSQRRGHGLLEAQVEESNRERPAGPCPGVGKPARCSLPRVAGVVVVVAVLAVVAGAVAGTGARPRALRSRRCISRGVSMGSALCRLTSPPGRWGRGSSPAAAWINRTCPLPRIGQSRCFGWRGSTRRSRSLPPIPQTPADPSLTAYVVLGVCRFWTARSGLAAWRKPTTP